MASLTKEQKDTVRAWLSQAAPIGHALECKTCSQGKLMEPSVIITLPGADDTPMVPLTCNRCAAVTFFNAQRMGL
jgi:hypothetical protein